MQPQKCVSARTKISVCKWNTRQLKKIMHRHNQFKTKKWELFFNSYVAAFLLGVMCITLFIQIVLYETNLFSFSFFIFCFIALTVPESGSVKSNAHHF